MLLKLKLFFFNHKRAINVAVVAVFVALHERGSASDPEKKNLASLRLCGKF
jgi:hypothetical protein